MLSCDSLAYGKNNKTSKKERCRRPCTCFLLPYFESCFESCFEKNMSKYRESSGKSGEIVGKTQGRKALKFQHKTPHPLKLRGFGFGGRHGTRTHKDCGKLNGCRHRSHVFESCHYPRGNIIARRSGLPCIRCAAGRHRPGRSLRPQNSASS